MQFGILENPKVGAGDRRGNLRAVSGQNQLRIRKGPPQVGDYPLLPGRVQVKVDPIDVNLLLLEQALRRAGRHAEADSASAQAQKISPDFAQARVAAGQFLSIAGLKPL